MYTLKLALGILIIVICGAFLGKIMRKIGSNLDFSGKIMNFFKWFKK